MLPVAAGCLGRSVGPHASAIPQDRIGRCMTGRGHGTFFPRAPLSLDDHKWYAKERGEPLVELIEAIFFDRR